MHGVQMVAMDMLVTHVHYPKNWRKKKRREEGSGGSEEGVEGTNISDA